MRVQFIFTLILFLSLCSYGQEPQPTENSTHIFWQPSVKLISVDFKGDTTAQIMDLCRKYNFSASASFVICSILDVPKKKKDRGKKLEKVYFAPAFCKAESFTLTQDTLQVAMQALFFDICELSARWARKNLQQLQDSLKGYGTLYIMFTTVEEEMQEMKKGMYASYFKEVFIDKNPGAYESWRKFYNEMLEETKAWATKPEECYRFISGKPVEPGYEMSPTVMPPVGQTQ